MRTIAFFCIPAHGHTNPMLPVASELVKRGNTVRFYSFDEFRSKIEKTGAVFISCNAFLAPLNAKEEKRIMNVSTTEMTIQDLRTTLYMDSFIEEEFKCFKPDVIYTDSVCFWGKLNAWKYNIPMVVSTSTFAFNQLSSTYMKNSPKEMLDLIFGLPKVSRVLKKMRHYGYKIKSIFPLVTNDNSTDTVVYTSKTFQPYSDSFSKHYCFVGPSLFLPVPERKENRKAQIYVSLGTVINERPNFYKMCIKAFSESEFKLVISCGNRIEVESFGDLPDNCQIYNSVNQLEVLAESNLFITHCGMNSASESLYMGVPMLLFPCTNEQHAVARRVKEVGAGVMLKNTSPDGILSSARKVLDNKQYKDSAYRLSKNFRECPGAEGAASFIENAPHKESFDVDIIKELNKANTKFQTIYWTLFIIALCLIGFTVGWKYAWIIGLPFGILPSIINKRIQLILYRHIIRKSNKDKTNKKIG